MTTSKKTFNLFIPITKVDETKREVYGLATAEVEDKSGEIFDYESSLPYYKEWSSEIHKASGGKSLGNVREMHTNIAAGKLTQINFNDDKKQIEVCAKIINDSTWEKVLEGVLTGFSHGGEYIKTWKDEDDPKVRRYTARPSELSVVDNPCLGVATFDLIRADGSTEMRKFKTKETSMTTDTDGKPAKPKYEPLQKWEASDGKTFEKKEDWRRYELELEAVTVNPALNPALQALDDLKKAVDDKEAPLPGSDEDPMTLGKKEFTDERRKKLAESGAAMSDGSFPIESVQDLKNAIHAYGRASNKDKAKAHIIARAKALGEEKMLPEGWGGEEGKDDNGADKSVKPKLKKGLYEVARAADLLSSMEYLCSSLVWEAAAEGDGSPLPNKFRDLITQMCTFLEELVEEECRELATPHAVELMGAEHMEMAAGTDALVKFAAKKTIVLSPEVATALTKAGARHSAADKGHLAKAMGHLEDAKDHLEDAKKSHGKVGEAHDGMRKCMGAMQDCMKAISTDQQKKIADHMDEMDGHMDKAEKHHGKIGKAHDTTAKAHDGIGESLDAVGAEPADDETEKAAVATLKKSQDELAAANEALAKKDAENAEMKKSLDELTKRVTAEIPVLIDRIKKLEAQPMPAKGALFDASGAGGLPVHKGHEGQTDPANAPVEAPVVTHGLSPEAQRRMMGIQ